MSEERTENASEQQKHKSREKGDIARSRELMSATALLGGLLMVRGAAGRFADAWQRTFVTALDNGVRTYDGGDALSRTLPSLLLPGIAPLVLVMAAAMFGALATGLLQTGGVHLHIDALRPGLSRVNPADNIKGIFSARSLVRFGKSLLPATCVVILASVSLKNNLISVPIYSYARLPMTLQAAYAVMMNAAWIFVVWGGLDYANEWRMWSGKLKMTKEEVRQEMKEANGNPQIKGRIRQIQRSMRRRRVKMDMSKAAVVVTNPTHYAVALEFDFAVLGAPKVLAKGRDLHALEIREEARWAEVPIVENAPLARSLYRSVSVGESIPFELYAAVAAILAFLYREHQQRAKQAKARSKNGNYASLSRILTGAIQYEPEVAHDR